MSDEVKNGQKRKKKKKKEGEKGGGRYMINAILKYTSNDSLKKTRMYIIAMLVE